MLFRSNNEQEVPEGNSDEQGEQPSDEVSSENPETENEDTPAKDIVGTEDQAG